MTFVLVKGMEVWDSISLFSASTIAFPKMYIIESVGIKQGFLTFMHLFFVTYKKAG